MADTPALATMAHGAVYAVPMGAALPTALLSALLAALAGGVLGALFYGSLWWTLQRALRSPNPALWQLGGTLVRTAFALAGFYLVGGGHWQQWLACLVGFMLARLLVMRLSKKWAAALQPPPVSSTPDHHAHQP